MVLVSVGIEPEEVIRSIVANCGLITVRANMQAASREVEVAPAQCTGTKVVCAVRNWYQAAREATIGCNEI